jgi:hypothetical protein
VKGPIPVAFRYQVASPANPARLGNRRRSIQPRESSSNIIGNSSKNSITTGARASAGTSTRARPASAPGSTSLPTGETVTNSRTNTSGAGVAYRSHSRATVLRA